MAGTLFRSFFSTALSITKTNTFNNTQKSIHTSAISYAARKGTRAKARAKKVKVEVTKIGFIPHNQRGRKNKEKRVNRNLHLDDTYKQIATDNVYPLRYYRWPVYTVEEAIQAHAETHHPSMYNDPEAFVYAHVEFNMEAVKKNRFMDNFTRLALLPHSFPRDEQRSILVFSKSTEMNKQALDNGAVTAGGPEIIKKIQDGTIKVADYDYVIAHPNILTELVPIRGLMKRRFPNVKNGTLNADIPGQVKKFANGINCAVTKDEYQQNYAKVVVPFARLNMDPKLAAENLTELLKELQSARPKRPGLFITRCLIKSPPSPEQFKIDPFALVDKTLDMDNEDSDDEEVAARA